MKPKSTEDGYKAEVAELFWEWYGNCHTECWLKEHRVRLNTDAYTRAQKLGIAFPLKKNDGEEVERPT